MEDCVPTHPRHQELRSFPQPYASQYIACPGKQRRPLSFRHQSSHPCHDLLLKTSVSM